MKPGGAESKLGVASEKQRYTENCAPNSPHGSARKASLLWGELQILARCMTTRPNTTLRKINCLRHRNEDVRLLSAMTTM